jgi:hypothetical protein
VDKQRNQYDDRQQGELEAASFEAEGSPEYLVAGETRIPIYQREADSSECN